MLMLTLGWMICERCVGTAADVGPADSSGAYGNGELYQSTWIDRPTRL